MSVTEEKLKEAADVFADFQNKREYVRSQKQEIINKIIPLEIQQQISDLEEEFAGKEEAIDLEEKTARRVLDMMIEQFVQPQQLTVETKKQVCNYKYGQRRCCLGCGGLGRFCYRRTP